MIDYSKAEAAFRAYTSQFDLKDDKIKLKWVHTFGVVDCIGIIAKKENLKEEDIELAKVIALLHDIGRFEQVKQFKNYDDQQLDHALTASHYLFEESHIRDFVEDNQYDKIIKEAVEKHSLFKVEKVADKRIDLHIKLIRDADKLDNFRVKDTEAIETILDMDEKLVAKEKITNYIFDQVLSSQLILASDRKTVIDKWVSYIAFIFDLNFRSSYVCLLENDYVKKNIERIDYQDPYTRKKMDLIKRHCQNYIRWQSSAK